MKTIGMLGGMSWESTLLYYKIINRKINEKLGRLHSAKIILYSFDFEEVEKLQSQGLWSESAELLAKTGKKLEEAGADFIVLCTNTMHKAIPEAEKHIKIPFLHIADSTAEIIIEKGIRKIGLLGTKFTMKEDFYKGRLEDKFGIKSLIPDEDDISKVNNIIYSELCKGVIKESSKKTFMDVIEKLTLSGAEGIILGCTEIGMLINQNDCSVPIFDTALIHAEAVAEYAVK